MCSQLGGVGTILPFLVSLRHIDVLFAVGGRTVNMSLNFISSWTDIEIFLEILVVGRLGILATKIVFKSNLWALNLFIFSGRLCLVQRMNEEI